MPEPPENPTTPEKAVLGKILFWDEQLSSDNTVACGSCHIPAAGGGDPRAGLESLHPGPDGVFDTADDRFGSMGVVRSDESDDYLASPQFGFRRQVTPRQSPSFIGAGFAPELFWDGRAEGTFIDPQSGTLSIQSGGALESQSVSPPVSDVEMAHVGRDWTQIAEKLEAARPLALAADLTPDIVSALAVDESYPELFASAFGDPAIDAERIAFALAAYQRTLVPDQTPFDLEQMTPRQEEGFRLFNGSGAFCVLCHRPPHFTDFSFRNIGVRPAAEDAGRMAVTGLENDRGKFKTPGLRNAGLRSRFFHNGEATSLEEVVEFYDQGGRFTEDPNFDFRIFPLRMTAEERAQVVDFVANALTDPRVALELFPFDRPRLHSESVPANPRLISGGVAGSDGFEPQMIAVTPPGSGFKLGVGRALGGATAFLVLTAASGEGGLQTAGEGGEPGLRKIRPASPSWSETRILETGWHRVTLDGSGPGGGYATLHFVLPPRSELAGEVVHARWIVFDPGAPGGRARSATAELRLPGVPADGEPGPTVEEPHSPATAGRTGIPARRTRDGR